MLVGVYKNSWFCLVLLGINFGLVYGLILPLGLILPWPYSIWIPFGIGFIIAIYTVRHFARKYNEKMATSSTTGKA